MGKVPQALTPHPVAMLFPDLPAADFAALVDDIRQHGVKVPILVHQGQILDGRHRYLACQELGRPCPTLQWNGRDPWFEAQSRNLVRRHLAKDQIWAIRKLAAARFPDLAAPIQAIKREAKQRQLRKGATNGQTSHQKGLLRSRDRNKESADLIGAQIGVSGTTVKRVDRLAREAPELLLKVAAGEFTVTRALREVALQSRDGAAIPKADPQILTIENVVDRLQQTIRSNWAKCPVQHQAMFLQGLKQVFRELVAEYDVTRNSRSGTSTTQALDRPSIRLREASP